MAVVSVGWSTISLAFGDKLVLAMANAKEIDKAQAPQLYNVVEEMAIAAGVPMPRVMVLETDALNAFATGNRVGHGTIVVTRGLLDTLSRDELQGVVAHEMAHLANLDTRYMVGGRRHGRPDRAGLRHAAAHDACGADRAAAAATRRAARAACSSSC